MHAKMALSFGMIAVLLLFHAMNASAQYIVREGNDEGEITSRTILVPYLFQRRLLGEGGLGEGVSYIPTLSP